MKSTVKDIFVRYYEDTEELGFWFITTKIVISIFFWVGIIISWKLSILDFDSTPIIFGVLPAYLGINLILFLLRKRKIPQLVILDGQLFVDIVVITTIIHLSGGVHSEMFFLYIFPLISATLIGPFASLAAGLTSAFFYGLLIYLEHKGFIAYGYAQHLGFQSDEKIRIGIFAMLISMVTFQTTYLMGRVKKKEQDIVQIKDDFISIASHQLKTPIFSLIWLVESFRKKVGSNLNIEDSQTLNKITDQTHKIAKLVENLLDLSRIRLGRYVKNFQEVRLGPFITDFIKDITPFAESNSKTVVLRTQEDLFLKTDPKMLYEILKNLTSNAVKYSPSSVPVVIDFWPGDNFMKFSVINKGPVIPKEEQSRLFQKFFRGKSTNNAGIEGAGLGLYIVKIYVESLGGKVGFNSEEDKETEFWFTLPVESKTKS